MKRETKRVIPLIALLLIIDTLVFGLIFYYQSRIIDEEYKETRQKQVNTLAELSTEALAGGDFTFLKVTLSQINQQKDILKAFVVAQKEQKILLSPHNEEYRKVFAENEMIELSSQIEPFRAPLSFLGKQWATLVVLFEKAPVNKKKKILAKRIIKIGVIIFFIGSILLVGAGKLVSRSYKHLLKSPQEHNIDVFTLPELKMSTVIAVKKDRDSELTEKELSPQLQRIIKIISPHKTVHDILLESPFDEPLTFELISSLLAYEKVELLKDRE